MAHHKSWFLWITFNPSKCLKIWICSKSRELCGIFCGENILMTSTYMSCMNTTFIVRSHYFKTLWNRCELEYDLFSGNHLSNNDSLKCFHIGLKQITMTSRSNILLVTRLSAMLTRADEMTSCPMNMIYDYVRAEIIKHSLAPTSSDPRRSLVHLDIYRWITGSACTVVAIDNQFDHGVRTPGCCFHPVCVFYNMLSVLTSFHD